MLLLAHIIIGLALIGLYLRDVFRAEQHELLFQSDFLIYVIGYNVVKIILWYLIFIKRKIKATWVYALFAAYLLARFLYYGEFSSVNNVMMTAIICVSAALLFANPSIDWLEENDDAEDSSKESVA